RQSAESIAPTLQPRLWTKSLEMQRSRKTLNSLAISNFLAHLYNILRKLRHRRHEKLSIDVRSAIRILQSNTGSPAAGKPGTPKIMIAHQGISMHPPTGLGAGLSQGGQKTVTILVILENGVPLVPPS